MDDNRQAQSLHALLPTLERFGGMQHAGEFPFLLPLNLNCFAETVPAGHAPFVHDMPRWAVVATLSGAATVSWASGESSLGAGDVFMAPPRCGFTERVGADEDWTLVYYDSPAPALDCLAQPKPEVYRFAWTADAFRRCLDLAWALARRPPGFELTAAGLALRIIDDVRGHVLGARTRLPDFGRKVLALLQRDLSRRWSVAEMASHCGMSPSSFAHRFRQEMGMTPMAFARRERVSLAKDLLARGLSVTEIAERLGFENSANFAKMFKNTTGCSPKVYQQRTFSRF